MLVIKLGFPLILKQLEKFFSFFCILNLQYENLAIVVSSEVSNQQKEVALNAILSEKEIISLENTLVGLIKEEGYSNVYVEYLDNCIKVVVKAEEVTNEQAAAIFTIVFENSETNLIPELEIIS